MILLPAEIGMQSSALDEASGGWREESFSWCYISSPTLASKGRVSVSAASKDSRRFTKWKREKDWFRGLLIFSFSDKETKHWGYVGLATVGVPRQFKWHFWVNPTVNQPLQTVLFESLTSQQGDPVRIHTFSVPWPYPQAGWGIWGVSSSEQHSRRGGCCTVTRIGTSHKCSEQR